MSLLIKRVVVIFWVALTGLAHADNIHVFLIGGQSNANGHARASDLPANLQAPQSDVLYYYNSNGITPNLVPLSPRTTFGPEVTFGRAMADYFAPSKARVAILQYAVGGSNLYIHWRPASVSGKDGVLLGRFKKTVADGMDALKAANPGATIHIDGMLWMQGEADGADKTGVSSAQYEANLTALVKEIRSTFGAQLPIVIGRLSSGQTTVGAHLNDIRLAQEKVASADAYTKMVNTDGFELFPDHLHFDAAGQQALGKAFAVAMQSLVAPN
jgi:hypothetical protein